MFNFFSSNSVLGVDIGTASIKIAEIEKSSARPKFKNYGILNTHGHLDRPNSAIQTNTLKLVEKETSEMISELVKKAKFKTREAVASIPSFSAFVTLIEMPQMSDEEIKKTMHFQIRQHIPLPIAEVAIDWMKVGEREEDGRQKQQILFISIPKETILRYQNIFRLANLKLKELEIESLALIRALAGGNMSPILIVDIGARSTSIAISDKGFLKTNIFTDFAGASLTQAIANGLEISARRAEELKKLKGLLATGGEYELSTLPQPYLDVIMKEIIRVKNDYERNYNQKIEKIILSGGGSKLLGIEKYFEKEMKTPVVAGNPFSGLDYPSEIGLLAKNIGPELAVAIGLGIK